MHTQNSIGIDEDADYSEGMTYISKTNTRHLR